MAGCIQLVDSDVARIVKAAPKIKEINFSRCKITDAALIRVSTPISFYGCPNNRVVGWRIDGLKSRLLQQYYKEFVGTTDCPLYWSFDCQVARVPRY
jgi:hypothetical protein